jgi:hypothetical protein
MGDLLGPRLCVELPGQPAAEQRTCGRRTDGRWKHGRAEMAAGDQASGRVETVHHGRRSQPTLNGRIAVQGYEHAEPEGEVAGPDHPKE